MLFGFGASTELSSFDVCGAQPPPTLDPDAPAIEPLVELAVIELPDAPLPANDCEASPPLAPLLISLATVPIALNTACQVSPRAP